MCRGLCIAHLIHRPTKIMELETFMPYKAATGFPQCDFKHCSNDKLRSKGGSTCGLVNKSLVWFGGRVVYALHSIDFVAVHPFQVDSPISPSPRGVKQIVMQS